MKNMRLALISLVLLFSVGCDQVTKHAARLHLKGAESHSYLGDTFRLTYAENQGAFLSAGASLPEGARMAIFVGFVSLFLIGFLVWMLRTKSLDRMSLIACSLLIGGGIGNLIDRVVFDGRVTDFMNMGIGSVRTGIFNVADIWIIAGVVMLLLAPGTWRAPKEEDAEAPAT